MTNPQLDLIESIEDFIARNRSNTPKYALLLTYVFNEGYFVDRLYPILQKGGIRNIFIIVDGYSPQTFVPKKAVHQVWKTSSRCSLFHPKMILLIMGDEIVVGLGSSNITSGGLSDNLELFQFFDLKEESWIVPWVTSFLESLTTKKIVCGGNKISIIKRIISFLPEGKQSSAQIAFDNIEYPLIDQMKKFLKKDIIKQIDIISPLNMNLGNENETASTEKDLKLFQTIKTRLNLHPRCKLRFLTDQWSSKSTIKDVNEVLSVDRSKNENNRRLHAKAYIFYAKDFIHFFWGTANLSQRALLYDGLSKNGNMEYLIYFKCKLKKDEFENKYLKNIFAACKDEPVNFQKTPFNLNLRKAQFRILDATYDAGKGKIIFYCDSLEKKLKHHVKIYYGNKSVDLLLRDGENKLESDNNIKPFLTFIRKLLDGINYQKEYKYKVNNYKGQFILNIDSVYDNKGTLEIISPENELFLDYLGKIFSIKKTDEETRETIDPVEIEDDEESSIYYQSSTDVFFHRWFRLFKYLTQKSKHYGSSYVENEIKRIKAVIEDSDYSKGQRRYLQYKIKEIQNFVREIS